MINVGGLKQSGWFAYLEKAITRDDFRFICNMEQKKVTTDHEESRIRCIATKVSNWYLG